MASLAASTSVAACSVCKTTSAPPGAAVPSIDGAAPTTAAAATVVRLKQCGRCKAPGVRYCSADCQRLDWPRHKLVCKSAADAHTADGAGAAVVSSRKSTAELEALAASLSTRLPSDAAFAVRALSPTRGLGLVSTRAIQQGELLLEEKALLVVPHSADAAQTRKQVADLPEQARADFFALHAFRGGGSDARALELEEAIVRTNGMRLSGSSTGLFVVAARLNHSCAANVHHVWHAADQRMRVIARRDIAAGEELCTHYTDALGTFDERQERLQRDYGFHCACTVCALSGAERAASDARRMALRELESSVLRALLSREYDECIRRVEERMALLEALVRDEGAYAPYSASRSCADALEASQALHKAAAARMAEGATNEQTQQLMQQRVRYWCERTRHFTLLAEGNDPRNPTLKQCDDIMKQLQSPPRQ